MNALLYFMPLFGAQKGRFLRTVLLSVVTLGAGIALLGVSGWFLTAAALTTAGAAFNLFGPSSLVRGLSFVRILSRYGEKTVGHSATLALLSDIRQWLFGALFPILPLRSTTIGRGEIIGRLVADVDALDIAFLVALGPISTALLAGCAMTLGLAIILPGASIAYAACYFSAVLLVPVGLVWLTRRAGNRQICAAGALRTAIVDGIDSHRDLIVFGATGRASNLVHDAAAELSVSKARLSIFGALASGLVQMLAGAAMVSVLACGLTAFAAGNIDAAVLVGLLFAIISSFEAAAPLVRGASRMASAAAAAERLQSLAQTAVAVRNSANAAPSLPGGRLEFSHVSFGYDDSHLVLRDVNLLIEQGQRVAIIGPSGAGKSTLGQLAARLYDPIAGTIKLNGVDLRAVDLGELRTRISVMTQDAPVFLDTVGNNLRIGRSDASDAELWGVLTQVGLDALVKGFADGLDTVVNEAGSSLSTGQARRLCLARTLLSNACIVMLDEPTSGLDEHAAAIFFAELPRFGDGRSLIVITHAAHMTCGFDSVLQLKDGVLRPVALP